MQYRVPVQLLEQGSMPSGDSSFQVVILAGGECKRLYPLTSVQSGLPKALLPVGNRPLISYPLKNLAEGGIKNAQVVRSSATEIANQPSMYHAS
jgi:NDP-sugar pyrophosphorylase family protein